MRSGGHRARRHPGEAGPHGGGRRQAQGGVPAPADGFGGYRIVGFGFDRDKFTEAGVQEAGALAAVTSGDNSNISRPASPARRSRSSGSSPASTTPAGPRSTSASASPPSRPCRGRPTRSCAGSSPGRTRPTGPTAADGCRWSSGPPGDWAGRPLAELSEPGRFLVVAVTRLGAARVVERDSIGQEGDVLHLVVDVTLLDAPGPAQRRRRSRHDERMRSGHEVRSLERPRAAERRA